MARSEAKQVIGSEDLDKFEDLITEYRDVFYTKDETSTGLLCAVLCTDVKPNRGVKGSSLSCQDILHLFFEIGCFFARQEVFILHAELCNRVSNTIDQFL